jgi:two-component system chemotaxis sensor kinase CheA
MTPDAVLGYYRNMNRIIIETLTEASKAPQNADASNYFKAIVYLLKTIEMTGQQRSPLLRAFELGSFKGVERLHAEALRNTIREQDYLAEVLAYATPDQLVQAREVFDSPAVKEAERLRAIGLNGLDTPKLQVNPTEWFQRQNEKILAYQRLKDRYLTGLVAMMEKMGFAARRDVFVSLTVALTVVAITLAAAFFIYILENKVAQRNREIRNLLDNMDEGIFTVDPKGVIEPGFSAAADRMIGPITSKTDFISMLSPDPGKQRPIRETFTALFNASIQLDWDEMLNLVPKEFQIKDSRWLRARFLPVHAESGERVERIMVILQDITNEKALKESMDATRAMHDTIVKILQNQETFDLFYSEALDVLADGRSQLEQMRSIDVESVNALFRGVHSIKGTAALFDLHDIVPLAHRTEDILRSLREQPDQPLNDRERKRLTSDFENLRAKIVAVRNQFLKMIGEEQGELTYRVPESKIARLEDQLAMITPPIARAQVHQECSKLKRVPTVRLLRKFEPLVQTTGEKLGKQVSLAIKEIDRTEIPRDYFRWLDPTFIHILRNSIDHGIELPEERMEHGKDPQAVIEFRTQYHGNGVLFSVSDDGRGIDVDRIRKVSVERGFLEPSVARDLAPKELLRLLFEPGFTSTGKVTQFSGRGMGLDIVKTELAKLGGRMRLTTRKGQGTSVELYVPLSA